MARQQYGNYRVSKKTIVGLVSEHPLTYDEIEGLIKYLELERDMLQENDKSEHWLLEMAKQRQELTKRIQPYTDD